MRPLDARTDEIGSELTAAVCVVGAGAAGMATALRLAERGVDTLLIESGGETPDGPTQALYRGRNVGLRYFDLLTSRLRFFGGTTNHWAGYCRANDPVNYAPRPDLGLPGWPVSFAEATRALEDAAAFLGVDPAFHEPETLLRAGGVALDGPVDEPGSDLLTSVNQILPQPRLRETHGPRVFEHPAIRVALHLNAFDLGLRADGRAIERVLCKTLTGKTVVVRARAYVVACHAIENARLLLASNAVEAAGVGNRRDQVGRCFSEHPQLDASVLAPSGAFPAHLDRAALRPLDLLAMLSATETAMRREGILAYNLSLRAMHLSDEARAATRRFARGLLEPFSLALLEDARLMLDDLPGLASLAADELGVGALARPTVVLNHTIEQFPNPDSRVLLSRDRRDALGMPEVDLDWRLHEVDFRTFRIGQEIAAREISARGYGRVALEPLDEALVRERVRGHWHHYGTTRMSESPAEGVVDATLRVHGVENLYMNGSSVFPTGGGHGPTLHIVAFALRLGDTIAARLPDMEPAP